MTLDTISLRFISDDDTFEFEADAYQYPLQINNAFIAFTKSTGKKSGQLELHHDIHGWHLICINHTYPIITNPMAIDFNVLAEAILETITTMNTWPIPNDVDDLELEPSKVAPHLSVVK